MINGVLQRLRIVEFDDTRLILRELPLLEWAIVGVLFIVAFNLALFQLWITAIATLLIGMVFAAQARMRVVRFDADSNLMTVEYVYLYKRLPVESKFLHEISRAYLEKADDGSTQIILVDVTGEKMGLSVYSQDVRPWKDEIVVAINTVLHEAHRDDADPEAVI
jgi:hypothetical protein